MNISHFSNRVIWMMIVTYKVFLDLIYHFYVVKYFQSQGFVDDFNIYRYILSWSILFVFIPFVIKYVRIETPSSIMMLTFNLMYFIPFLTLYALSGFSSSFFFYTMIYWLVMTLFYNFIGDKRALVRTNDRLFYVLLFFIVLLNTIFTIYYNGLVFKFNFENVYDIRLAVRDMDLPGFLGYLKPTATIFTLCGIIFSIIKKKWLWLCFFTISQLLAFSFGAHKSDFMYLFVAYILGFCGYNRSWGGLFIILLILLLIFSAIELYLYDVSFVGEIIIRRIIFMPSRLSFDFYEYFSNHELALLRNSILGKLGFESPYKDDIARIIGSELGNDEMNANTGICGDDFAQLGWYGLMFYPFIRVYLITFYDRCIKFIDTKIVFFVSVYYAVIFISGSLFSVLLTNGFLITCIVFMFKRREKLQYVSTQKKAQS